MIPTISFGLPDTKKQAYYKLKDFITTYYTKRASNPNIRPEASMCIEGPRHCGKTTALLQLKEYFQQEGYNVFYKCFKDNEDFDMTAEQVLEEKYHILLIDEICKADNEAQKCFTNLVKTLQIYGIPCIYTGSTASILDNLWDNIGRGSMIEMPIMTFTEYLKWKYDMEDIWSNKEKAKQLQNMATNDDLLDFISESRSFYNTDISEYITQCVEDTITSFLNRKDIKLDVDSKELNTVLLYLSLKQVVNLNKLIDIRIYGGILEYVNNIIKQIRDKYNSIPKENLRIIIEVLEGSNLIKTSVNYNGDMYYYFIHPWIFIEYLNESGISSWVNSIKPIEDIWIESYITNLCCNLYNECGKYRVITDEGEQEVDILMGNYNPISAIEIKNSPYNNAIKKQIKAYDFVRSLSIKRNLNIDYIFTYSVSTDNYTNQSPNNINSISNKDLIFILEMYILANKDDKHNAIKDILQDWSDI